MTYDFNLLAWHEHDACPELDGLIAGNWKDEMTQRRTLELLALSCDERIPQRASGYVSQIASPTSIRSVREDALRQLSRYVPIT